MAVSPRLQIRLTRQLALTPQLQQAISLLQMTNAELDDFLQAETERNPFLEYSHPRIAAGGSFDGAEDIGETETLAHHLTRQIGVMRAPDDQRSLAAEIAYHLDEDGYLRTPLTEIAAARGCNIDLAQKALALVQACSPAGVGARSLGECLRLQLDDAAAADPATVKLTENMQLAAASDLKELKRLTGLTVSEIRCRLSTLRTLDPAPGSRFSGPQAVTRVPDIVVTADGNSGWLVAHAPGSLPQIRLSADYPAGMKQPGSTLPKELEELEKRSRWLIRTLDQRKQTILRVTGAILRLQEPFLTLGESALAPMTMKQVAVAAGVHESTISRAVTGKFIESPQGIFALRKLFSARLPDQKVSGASARHRVAKLLETESGGSVLTDQAIADRLATEGIVVARRTVAKYRAGLRKPTAAQRRQLKPEHSIVF